MLQAQTTTPPLYQFLSSHRNLNAQDIDFYHRLLTRIAVETGQC
jgi:hypothetical protein